MAPILDLVRSTNSRLLMGVFGLLLLVKRSPKNVEGITDQTIEWAEQMGRFLLDPENAIGLVMLLMAAGVLRNSVVRIERNAAGDPGSKPDAES